MALLHRADVTPTKLELLAGWLPGRPWFQGTPSAELVRVSAYRFDDPAGAVGLETMLVRAGDGPVLQVPLSYRPAPLDGAEQWLIATTEHSVLGRRWLYDACGDPVYAAELSRVIHAGGTQAEEYFEVDGRRETRRPAMTVCGSGTGDAPVPAAGVVRRVVDEDPTVIVTDDVELAVLRRLGTSQRVTGPVLTGAWGDEPLPVPLAYAV
ncbi:hypothetical protein GCM10020358_66290 [Amorphoplanes nipponensis]|uniref:Maltokinase N-terminal cap domain-containing protein n=1 Tax=Actinoplanes nipponensis TaxID=135950 RepID=A0A919MP72_9ACTN|nr:hypothetical protein [Actinoplanes nipponensis]GIE51742.1 hypothetical protein Ani05nite_52760 [Actinoplanes nipponensis]